MVIVQFEIAQFYIVHYQLLVLFLIVQTLSAQFYIVNYQLLGVFPIVQALPAQLYLGRLQVITANIRKKSKRVTFTPAYSFWG